MHATVSQGQSLTTILLHMQQADSFYSPDDDDFPIKAGFPILEVCMLPCCCCVTRLLLLIHTCT